MRRQAYLGTWKSGSPDGWASPMNATSITRRLRRPLRVLLTIKTWCLRWVGVVVVDDDDDDADEEHSPSIC